MKHFSYLSLIAVAALAGCVVPQTPPLPDQVIELSPGIRLNRTRNELIIRAQVAARIGWMEQVVCKAGTREHESLLVVDVAPRLIHAALLALGCTPGSPGSWRESLTAEGESNGFALILPTGSRLDILVRFTRAGEQVEVPICEWLRSETPAGESMGFPRDKFVFAGSHVRPNPKSLGPGEHYVADYTGSVIGLVTFGDEVIGFEEVIPDRVEFTPALWEAHTDRIPHEGSDVELIIRPLARIE